MRAEVASAAGDDDAANRGAAAKAFFALAIVDAVLPLKFALLAGRIDVVRNRRAARANRLVQNMLQGAIQPVQFLLRKICSEAPGMDFRAPEAFVRVDIAYAAQHRLIEEQSLDVRFARVERRGELCFGGFERIEAERTENLFLIGGGQDAHASEAANVGVAQLATVVEGEKDMRVRAGGGSSGIDDELAGHAEVHDQRKFSHAIRRCQLKDQEFSVAADLLDMRAGEIALERGGIVDEVGFTQAHAEDAAARQDGPEAADDSLDFRQLWHAKTLYPKLEIGNSKNGKEKRENGKGCATNLLTRQGHAQEAFGEAIPDRRNGAKQTFPTTVRGRPRLIAASRIEIALPVPTTFCISIFVARHPSLASLVAGCRRLDVSDS